MLGSGGGGVLGNKYLFLPPKKSLRYCTRLHGIPGTGYRTMVLQTTLLEEGGKGGGGDRIPHQGFTDYFAGGEEGRKGEKGGERGEGEGEADGIPHQEFADYFPGEVGKGGRGERGERGERGKRRRGRELKHFLIS